MSGKFATLAHLDAFATEGEATASVAEKLGGRAADQRSLGQDAKLYAVNGELFVVAVENGGFAVYSGTQDLVYDSQGEAEEWIEEYENIGDHNAWRIFEL